MEGEMEREREREREGVETGKSEYKPENGMSWRLVVNRL